MEGGAAPLRLLMSTAARARSEANVVDLLGGRPHRFVSLVDDADLAFVSRDETGLSTKHIVMPETQRFYEALLSAPSLGWVHIHSAGADRPIYLELQRRGIRLTTSSEANSEVVVKTALAGILSMARRLPVLSTRSGEGSGRRWWAIGCLVTWRVTRH